MGINNYKIVKNLGQGSYGSVYLAKNLVSKSNDEYVAIMGNMLAADER